MEPSDNTEYAVFLTFQSAAVCRVINHVSISSKKAADTLIIPYSCVFSDNNLALSCKDSPACDLCVWVREESELEQIHSAALALFFTSRYLWYIGWFPRLYRSKRPYVPLFIKRDNWIVLYSKVIFNPILNYTFQFKFNEVHLKYTIMFNLRFIRICIGVA